MQFGSTSSLKVSGRAWHYRYYVWLWGSMPTNLCSYFWGIVLGTLLLPVVTIFNLFHGMKWISSIAQIALLLFLTAMLVWAIIDSWWNILIIPVVLIAVFLFAIFVTAAFSWIKSRFRQSEGDSVVRLSWEYAKAKKRRICPLIEIVK